MTQTNGYVDPSAWAELQAFAPANGQDQMRLLLQTIGRFVGAQTKPLRDEIAKLKTQVAELQANGVRFCGTFQRGNSYKVGEMCSFDGSIWCALVDTKPLQIPGKDAAWQLAVRGQRDAPRLPTKGVYHPTIVERRT